VGHAYLSSSSGGGSGGGSALAAANSGPGSRPRPRCVLLQDLDGHPIQVVALPLSRL
jgi:hypothetical protein